MSQLNFIKDIAKFGLENDQEQLLQALNELISHAKQTKKINFALQLQSLLKETIRHKANSTMLRVGSEKHIIREEDREINDLIIEKLTSEYSFEDLVCSDAIRDELQFFADEHLAIDLLRLHNLPVSNKVLFYGPSGCGKTLAAYVMAGELEKLMVVINLGAIVSSKLGETSKNLSKIFRRAATEDCIIFIDEFDSLGKVRDFSQDHGEMKRVVNTILQLFDYLPQNSIVIAATNHPEMIDHALLRRFDLRLQFELPDQDHIEKIINKTLKNDSFKLDKKSNFPLIVEKSKGLSYFSIQKALINAIKRSLFRKQDKIKTLIPRIETGILLELLEKEKMDISL